MDIRISSGGAAQSVIGLMEANSFMGKSYIDYLESVQEGIQYEGESQQLGFNAKKAAGAEMAKQSMTQSMVSGVTAFADAASAAGTTITSYSKGNEIEALRGKQESIAGFTKQLDAKTLDAAEITPDNLAKAKNNNFFNNARLPAAESTDPFDALAQEHKQSYLDKKSSIRRKTGESDLNLKQINADIANPAGTPMQDALDASMQDRPGVKKGLQQQSKRYGSKIDALQNELHSTTTTIRTLSQAGQGISNSIGSGLQAKMKKDEATQAALAEVLAAVAQSQGQGNDMLSKAGESLLQAVRNNSETVVGLGGADAKKA